jgi:ABC-2 type transport system ATP-binding protein
MALEGTQDDPKKQIGGEVIEVKLTKVADRHGELQTVCDLLRDLAAADPVIDHEAPSVRVPVEGGSSILAETVRRLDAAGIEVSELILHRPTLDDDFLTLTGHHAGAEATDDGEIPGPTGRPGRPIDRRGPPPGGTPA